MLNNYDGGNSRSSSMDHSSKRSFSRSDSMFSEHRSHSHVSEIEISDISLHNLPKLGMSSWDDRFRVSIGVDNQLQTTSWESRSYSWHKKRRFQVAATESSKVTLNIFARDIRHSQRIASFEDTVAKLLNRPSPIKRTINLYGSQDHKLEIEFKIVPSPKIDKFCISYIDLQDLPSVNHNTFFLRVAVDDTVWQSTSKSSKQGHSRWTDGHSYPFHCDSHGSLEIFATRYLHKYKPIAVVQGPVKEWLAAPNGVVRQTLESVGAKIQAEFKIAQISGTPHTGNHCAEDAGNAKIERNDCDVVLGANQIDALDISAVILDIDRVPKFGKLSSDDRFFLEIIVDDNGVSQKVRSQGLREKKSLMWDTTFTLKVSKTSQVVFRVLGYDGKDSDEIPIGRAICPLDEILHQNSLIQRQLLPMTSATSVHTDGIPTLSFRAMRSGTESFAGSQGSFRQDLSTVVNETANAIVQQNETWNHDHDKQFIHDAMSRAHLVTGGDAHLSPLMLKIGVFVLVAERLAQVHPYARLAFSVLTAGYEVIRQRFACDDGVCQLIRTMHDTYDLLTTIETLAHLQRKKEIVNAIVRQTIECAFFIRDYADKRDNFAQAIKNSILNIEAQILAFKEKFLSLQNQFRLYVAGDTHLTVLKLHDEFRDHAAKADFRDMEYVADARCAASCGMHQPAVATPPDDVIASIQSWVIGESKESERICVLYGPDESCSAITRVIGEHFQRASRLGSSYCFRREPKVRNYTNLFTTIARDLADKNAWFKDNLGSIVKNDTSLRSTRVVRTQFEEFILAPSRDAIWTGPLLVIIDGLELGGNEASRKDILAVLADQGADLPRNLRFLITCNPEDDICKAFRGLPHILRRQLGKTTSSIGAENHASSHALSPSPPSLATDTSQSPPPYDLEGRRNSTSSSSSSESSASGLTSFSHTRAVSPITSIESGFDEKDASRFMT